MEARQVSWGEKAPTEEKEGRKKFQRAEVFVAVQTQAVRWDACRSPVPLRSAEPRARRAPAGEKAGRLLAALLAQPCFRQAARNPGEIVSGQRRERPRRKYWIR